MNNPLTHTQNKLRKIGIIGKWICNVGLFLSFFVAAFYIVLGLQNELSAHKAGGITIYFIAPDKDLSSTVKTQANAAIDELMKQANLVTFSSFVLAIVFYAVVIGFILFLLRKICVELSQSNIFSAKNARYFSITGWSFLGWYLASLFEVFSAHRIITTGTNINIYPNHADPSWLYDFEATFLNPLHIYHDPLILLLGLVFLAFGWAIKQSIALQEEQSLTI